MSTSPNVHTDGHPSEYERTVLSLYEQFRVHVADARALETALDVATALRATEHDPEPKAPNAAL